MDITHLQQMATASGGILYLMAVLLFVALTVIIERTWYLGRSLSCGSKVLRKLRDRGVLDAASDLRGRGHERPAVRVLAVALQHPGIDDRKILAELIEEEILTQAPLFDARLWMLDTIVTAAPLLGLLGTIIGMFQTFQVLGDARSAPTAVTGGVGEALVATACGLFIALIGLFAYNNLTNRVRLAMHQLETLKAMLINRLVPAAEGYTESVAAPAKLRAKGGI